MAEAAISFAVEKLGDLAIQKVDFLRGVKGQVNWLKDELRRMQSFLKDAAEKQVNDERIRNWISEIRELAQDAEDVVETFILKIETPRRSRGLLGRCTYFPKHVYHLDRLGEEIESIRNRLRDIDESRQRFGIQDLSGESILSRRSEDGGGRRRLSPWQKDKQVVGLEEDVDLLLRKAILEERERLSVASIVGMGGIGKSTLAREVYNHTAVTACFDCRAWVVVSREFNPKEIIKGLILQLVEQQRHSQMMEIIQQSDVQNAMYMLHQQLKGKRYFIVLDDVWQDEAWESLAPAFPDEDRASRLLLTSRSQDIAKYARFSHKMNFLNPDQSWELFLNKAFIDNTDGKCPKDLENTGREILKKCNGLPLAITVVGGLLVKKRRSKIEWEKVLKGVDYHLGSNRSSVSAILELSYHDLPPQLKSCFLCLSFFKEDAIIRVSKLVSMWIAQGLVLQGGEEKEMMEEIARSYLDELINRNMVQVKEMSTDNRVKSCYMHDVLRELSITNAKEEINFEILKQENSQSSDKARHRSIYCNTERFPHAGNLNRHIRSLFVHGVGKVDHSPSYWKSFGLLRVLDFEDFRLMNVPDAIGALTQLRYLGLRNTKIKKLPSSLGCLKNLLVLDIVKNYEVEMPNVLWKMASLRHLRMSRIKCQLPLRLDTLKDIQTLTYIPANSWIPEHLAQMTSLRKLGIELTRNSDVGELCTSLATLKNLIHLKIAIFDDRMPVALSLYGTLPSLDQLIILRHLPQLKLCGSLTKLPSATNFPPNLSYLSLVHTHLQNDPMPVLQKLPELLYLKLDNAYTGEEIVISRDGFPRLKVLCLHMLMSLSNMQVEKGAMAELYRLEICNCPSLESLPEELRFISCLSELKMVTSAEVASKLQDHVASHIISNIPSVDLIVDPYVDLCRHMQVLIKEEVRRMIDQMINEPKDEQAA